MDGSTLIILILSLLFFLDKIGRTNFSKSDAKEYMQSNKWKATRQLILLRDDYSCLSCSSKDRLEIHHITYKRMGNEKLSDLATVCRNCHQEIHDKYGYYKGREFPLIKRRNNNNVPM